MAGSILSKRASSEETKDDRSAEGTFVGLLNASKSLKESDFGLVAAVSVLYSVIASYLVFSRSNFYIELADQSLYLLMIDEPRASIRSASGYHVLLSPLFSAVGESVIDFRRLRAVLDIGVDIGLGLTLVRYLRSRDYSGLFDSTAAAVAVVSSVTLGGFASWIYAVNGFGYDQLGAMIFTVLVSLLLWIVSGEDSPSTAAVASAVAGAVFAMAIVVRWTAALASVFLIVWILVEHVGKRRAVTLLGAGAVGAVGAFGTVHVTILPLGVVFGGLRSGTIDVGRDSHSLSVLVSEYAEWLIRGFGAGVGLLVGSLAALLLLKVRDRVDSSLLAGLLTAGLIMFVVQTVYGLPHFVEAIVVGTFLGLMCGALVLARLQENRRASSAWWGSGLAFPVTLTALPVLLAAGSLLPLFLTSLPLATLWVAGLWIMVPTAKDERLRTIAMLFGAVLLSGMPLLVWQSLANPARTPFAERPVLVERGRYAGIYTDELTQQLLHDLEDLRVELDPNPTVLSFWVRPAVPFALEGTGIGFPWYSETNAPNAAAETISGACLEDGDIPTGDVVLVTEEANPAEWGPIHTALLDCGINFPVGFELIDTLVAPGSVELFVYLREGNE